MKTRFDHMYTADQGHQFRTKLGKAGFFIDDHEVEHPGKAFCRFIAFPQKSIYQYLEFIHIGKGGDADFKVGISFAAGSSLKAYNDQLNKKGLKTEFNHKNYSWKENSIDNLPGWNFVTFKRKMNIFTWLTEYEDSPKRKKRRKKKVTHPNGAYKILGVEITLTQKDLEFYKAILGKPKNQTFNLECGTPLRYKVGRTSRVDQVIIATKDLTKFVKKFQWDELSTWNDKPAAVIKNTDSKMWDVVLVAD